MLWRDTQLRVAILGIDAWAWSLLLIPAFHARVWTLAIALTGIVLMGIVRFWGVTPQYLMHRIRGFLLGPVRTTYMKENLFRAPMRRL